MNEKLELGYISGFFGVKGWVKIYSYSRPRENICNYSNFYIGDDAVETKFNEVKQLSKHIIGKINNVDSLESAQQFIGKTLYLAKSRLPRLKNEYYWSELIGLNVFNNDAELIGEVTGLLETGVNDVLVIKNKEKENASETLIPYIFGHFVISVDLVANKMIVDWEIDADN